MKDKKTKQYNKVSLATSKESLKIYKSIKVKKSLSLEFINKKNVVYAKKNLRYLLLKS